MAICLRTRAIPMNDLDQVGPSTPPEHEQVASKGILMQHALHQHGEAVDPFAHVDEAQRQMHLLR